MNFTNAIQDIFSFEEKALMGFQKKHYESTFLQFVDIEKSLIDEIQKCSDKEKEQVISLVANEFVTVIQNDLKNYTGLKKFKLREARENHNMYMVGYVLPGLLKQKDDFYRDLAKEICNQWALNFKNSHIQAAEYETIASGFVGKLFGMTITN